MSRKPLLSRLQDKAVFDHLAKIFKSGAQLAAGDKNIEALCILPASVMSTASMWKQLLCNQGMRVFFIVITIYSCSGPESGPYSLRLI